MFIHVIHIVRYPDLLNTQNLGGNSCPWIPFLADDTISLQQQTSVKLSLPMPDTHRQPRCMHG